MNLIPVFNKNLPWAHTELEFDMFGVHGKLVKYVVHLCKRKKKIKFFMQAIQTTINQFFVQGILGVNFRWKIKCNEFQISKFFGRSNFHCNFNILNNIYFKLYY
jgi:hypothetical protein